MTRRAQASSVFIRTTKKKGETSFIMTLFSVEQFKLPSYINLFEYTTYKRSKEVA